MVYVAVCEKGVLAMELLASPPPKRDVVDTSVVNEEHKPFPTLFGVLWCIFEISALYIDAVE